MKKNITLFINSLTSGGAEKVLSLLATELHKQAYTITLICIEKDDFYPLDKEIKRIYLSSLTKEDSALKKLLYLPLLAWRLKKYSQKNKIDLIQSHIYRANFTNILSKLFGAKHQVQVVEVISINYFQEASFNKKINLKLIEWLYPHTDKIIFKAQKMRLEFFKTLKWTKEHTVINNPYDIQKIHTLSQEKINNFNFEDQKRYIINVGRLEKQKNQQGIIEALASFEESVELIILGEGSQREILEKQAQALNIEQRVHLLGNQKNPFKYIKKADIFVLNSNEEGFPNVLVEAMICSTAVISTDCISGPREILAPKSNIDFQLTQEIERADNGILIPTENNASLVKAIELLLSNSMLQEQYQQQAKRQAENYSVQTIIEKYKKALQCVA